jgi:hypothetical protein
VPESVHGKETLLAPAGMYVCTHPAKLTILRLTMNRRLVGSSKGNLASMTIAGPQQMPHQLLPRRNVWKIAFAAFEARQSVLGYFKQENESSQRITLLETAGNIFLNT